MGFSELKKEFNLPRHRVPRTMKGRKGGRCSSQGNKNVSATSTNPLHTSDRTNMIKHSRSYRNLSILGAHSSEVQKLHGPWLRCYSRGLQAHRYLSEAFRTQGSHEKCQLKIWS